ncbi:HEPN domain-containing protein [Halomarina oriensis]|uniref:HEPN domain-containing protein n=1 Tax=Halomarina oriensis TaxID=671145 RepID=A0A6B0GGV8_9EURY|nr:HEPN domain-containing protein [Halomarina oriensis]MWG33790.1 HEPN domain-containing protein [Halomarina oriensis]
MPEDGPGSAEVEDQLRQAREAFSDASGARDAGLSDAVVINRLYYTCFHAAQAALYDRGLDPTTHGGVLSLFGSELVASGEAAREDGRFLNDLGELRQRADYGYGTIDENVDALLARTRRFLSDVEELCSTTD